MRTTDRRTDRRRALWRTTQSAWGEQTARVPVVVEGSALVLDVPDRMGEKKAGRQKRERRPALVKLPREHHEGTSGGLRAA